jgi:hypothetical protein
VTSIGHNGVGRWRTKQRRLVPNSPQFSPSPRAFVHFMMREFHRCALRLTGKRIIVRNCSPTGIMGTLSLDIPEVENFLYFPATKRRLKRFRRMRNPAHCGPLRGMSICISASAMPPPSSSTRGFSACVGGIRVSSREAKVTSTPVAKSRSS